MYKKVLPLCILILSIVAVPSLMAEEVQVDINNDSEIKNVVVSRSPILTPYTPQIVYASNFVKVKENTNYNFPHQLGQEFIKMDVILKDVSGKIIGVNTSYRSDRWGMYGVLWGDSYCDMNECNIFFKRNYYPEGAHRFIDSIRVIIWN